METGSAGLAEQLQLEDAQLSSCISQKLELVHIAMNQKTLIAGQCPYREISPYFTWHFETSPVIFPWPFFWLAYVFLLIGHSGL